MSRHTLTRTCSHMPAKVVAIESARLGPLLLVSPPIALGATDAIPLRVQWRTLPRRVHWRTSGGSRCRSAAWFRLDHQRLLAGRGDYRSRDTGVQSSQSLFERLETEDTVSTIGTNRGSGHSYRSLRQMSFLGHVARTARTNTSDFETWTNTTGRHLWPGRPLDCRAANTTSPGLNSAGAPIPVMVPSSVMNTTHRFRQPSHRWRLVIHRASFRYSKRLQGMS